MVSILIQLEVGWEVRKSKKLNKKNWRVSILIQLEVGWEEISFSP
tara:strand:+ start:212 stop:346 length:135 start_codon:yes stop_codon:yes gene_type:complete